MVNHLIIGGGGCSCNYGQGSNNKGLVCQHGKKSSHVIEEECSHNLMKEHDVVVSTCKHNKNSPHWQYDYCSHSKASKHSYNVCKCGYEYSHDVDVECEHGEIGEHDYTVKCEHGKEEKHSIKTKCAAHGIEDPHKIEHPCIHGNTGEHTIYAGCSHGENEPHEYTVTRKTNEYPETEYLKFINLGLVIRENVDVSLEADVHSVKNTINGEEMTYEYGQNDVDSTAEGYNTNVEADRPANAHHKDDPYELKLYDSDYNYRYDEYYDDNDVKAYKTTTTDKDSGELTTEITYRVKLHNKAIEETTGLNVEDKDIPINVAFNEIAIYYDENFISKDTIEALKSAQEIVKNKNTETGLFYDKTIKSVRVLYDTEENLNNSQSPIDISDCISFTSKYSNNNLDESQKATLLANGYNVLYISTNTANNPIDNCYLSEGEERILEIKFIVDKDSSRALKIEDSLDMIAEVNAYTTKYGSDYYHKALANKYAGVVDSDSNPGGVCINDGIETYSNYEDDTYKTNIKLSLLSEPDDSDDPEDTDNNAYTRTITGMVWDDKITKEIGTESTGLQNLGDGNYSKNDDGVIQDVKVTLMEIIQTGAGKYFEQPAKYTYDVKDQSGKTIHTKGEIISTRTNSEGKYSLTNYVPGYYTVRFTYGDDETLENNVKYNGQDYKSASYYNDGYYTEDKKYNSNDNLGSTSNFEYFDNVKNSLTIENKSDALDDEIRRLNVNSYSETMTTKQAQVFAKSIIDDVDSKPNNVNEIESGKKYKEDYQKELVENTYMYADTTIFYVKPEEVLSSEITIDTSSDKFKERLWKLNNLDFGLEFRPQASIVLDKNIESVELITSDNKTLAKLLFKDSKDADGNKIRIIDEAKSKGNENVQFLQNKGKDEQGFVYVNMDTDILEGCTINVEYMMDATNESDIDRINKNLNDIRYEKLAVDKNYANKVYIGNDYSANATAAELLAQKYYHKAGTDQTNFFDTNSKDVVYKYLQKIKKPYLSSGTTTINTTSLSGTEYYGIYLGETYYTGEIGSNDIVADLKIDHILDYVDNDFTFELKDNNTENKMWQLSSSEELRGLLDWNKVNNEAYDATKGFGNLIDRDGIRYDTENRSNLAISVNDNKQGKYSDERTKEGNASLSRFLKTKKLNTDEKVNTGRISAVVSKVLSADDIAIGKGLNYENISEIVQYTTLTGRRTKLPNTKGSGGVLGNVNVTNWNGYETFEDDTDASEVITISPPTGLVK